MKDPFSGLPSEDAATHLNNFGFETVIIQKIYARLNFSSRNLLDSAAGGTFMEITLGEATKLLDNIMVNYSQ